MASIVLAVGAPAAVAGSASWAHQSGAVSSNGAVIVKSLSGASYNTTQNPTGAVAKASQSASTQPPTVIIQATSGSTFNYKDDCYLFYPQQGQGHTNQNNIRIGVGKLDASNNFTGLIADASSGSAAAAYLVGAMIGVSPSIGSISDRHQVRYASSASTAWAIANNGYEIVIVSSIATYSATKCYT